MSEREPGHPAEHDPAADPYTAYPGEPASPHAQYAEPPSRWTAGRIIALVVGSLLALLALGLLVTGIVALIINETQRDNAGYIVTDTVELETQSYAVVSTGINVAGSPDWVQVERVTGEIELRVEGAGDTPVFVGMAREQDARDYLAGLSYDEVTRIGGGDVDYRPHSGGEPQTPPGDQEFWAASVEGTGLQTLTFRPEDGTWVIVAMNADASAGVDVFGSVAAELPILSGFAMALLIAGGILILLAIVLLFVALRRP